MRFKIVSVGWNCAQFITQTLDSIDSQTVENYNVVVVDDATDDPRQIQTINSWLDAKGDWRWRAQFNMERQGPVRNQYGAIEALDPEDDDVIVWLDLDGDTFAHPSVLDDLMTAYSDGETLMTYGSYRPVPDMGTSTMPTPYPPKVVLENTYRHETLNVCTRFNHLRTMSGKLFRSIPEDQFHWPDGRWYGAGVDYIFMVAGLELAGGRYKCLDEVLMFYNHANPHSMDAEYHRETARCNVDFLNRTPLRSLGPIVGPKETPNRLPHSHRPEDWTEEWLPAENRRDLLREMARIYDLDVFIETGTHTGDTPMALKDDFSELHTIELGENYYTRARQLFRPYSQVTCWLGDSSEVLRQVLGVISAPALVWLDGHHSGGETARGQMDSPIRAELDLIFADARPHVILVDDMRCFDEGSEHELYEHYADYPSITWIREQAEAHGYLCVVEDDIARLTPW